MFHRFVARILVVTSARAAVLVALAGVSGARAEPDFSGVWLPDVRDQKRQEMANMPPWTPTVLTQVRHLIAEEQAGRPFLVLSHCLPHGMPSWMLITHNPFEILTTPGRVTLIGEGDGNRMRRIYTDGRGHPEDPDPTLHGHSIGHWEDDTLVVDTTAILPQSYIAISEAVGIPSNGDMHVVERLHLLNPDTLADDLEISANKVLSKPWHTTRKYYRQRAKKYDILEGVCDQGFYTDAVDANGNSIFAPIKFHNGVPVGPDSK